MSKIIKTIKKINDEHFIEFTDDELKELDLSIGDQFECFVDDFSLVLKKIKMSEIELDLNLFDKESLVMIIERMHKNKKTLDEVISELLENMVNDYEFINKYILTNDI